jgi:hypothetical protein
VEKLRKISLLVLMSLVLVAGMLASTPTPTKAEYSLGAPAAFYVKLPNGGQWQNATNVLTIGDKFNITCGIQNVADMAGYGFTLTWNATYMNMTRWWLDPWFVTLRNNGSWSAAMLEFWTNDLRERPTLSVLPPRIGMFCGLGQTNLLGPTLTGTFNICTIEFQINAFGPHGFYIWKEPVYYAPWPYNSTINNGPRHCNPYLQNEGAFPESLHQTYSGWVDSATTKQNYTVVWCPNALFAPPSPTSGHVANAVLWISQWVIPEFSAPLLMLLFLTATIIAVAVAKTWSKKPKSRINVK